ncbi:MAG: hypothetical protein P4L83_23185 [Nevskia sp.]|nr:hypothetical protein [Nevskia sp.]
MAELERCGFQPVGNLVTQGSGATGRALSADGTTWAEIGTLRRGLYDSLRQLLKTGELRGAMRTAQFTTDFNDGRRIVTVTADRLAAPEADIERLTPEASLAALAQRHMQRIEAYLREHHPIKPLIHGGTEESGPVEAEAKARLAPQTAMTVDGLRELGVAPHLARLIAGPCQHPAEVFVP